LAANLAMSLLNKRQLRTGYESAVIEQKKAVINFKLTLLTTVGGVSDVMESSEIP